MKLNLYLIGILISCIAAVNGSTTITGVKTLPSKTLPVSISTSTLTTTIIESKAIPSKTLPISTSIIISTPTIPIVTYNPEEPWYVGSNGNYHVIKKYYSVSACKLKDGISRSVEEYKECLDAIGISDFYYKDYIKYYGAKTTKTVPAYKVKNPYKKTCPAKGGWVVQFEKPANEYCKMFDAYVIKVSDEEDCSDNLYVCDASYPSIIKDKSPSKSLLSFSETITTTTTTSTKIILPTTQATPSSNTKCCTGDSCIESDYKCCQTDQPVVVNLVDKLGVWGIQAFEKGYDWCLYKDISPIITTPKSNVFVFHDPRGAMTQLTPPMATVTLPYYVSEVTVSKNSGEDYRLCEGSYCYDYYGEFNYRENTFTVYTKQNYPITTIVRTSCSSENKCSTYTYSANPKPSSISINILPGSTKAPLTTKTPPITTTTTTITTTTTKVPLTTKTLPITTTTTTTTITTTTTKVPLTTKTIPCEPVIVTVTERETITQKEKVTVTVTVKAMETTKCADKWDQCGGANYNGPTCCPSGSTCHKINQYYFQCI